MEEQHETALTLMRKSIEKLGSSTQKHGDPTLMRFLIARSMDWEKAAEMFVEWDKWRTQFVPLGFIPENEVSDQLDSRKIFLQGLSKHGHPLLIVKTNRHFRSTDHLQFKSLLKILRLGASAAVKLTSLTCSPSHLGIPNFFFLEFVVHLLDKTIASGFKEGREVGNEKLIGIIDLANISYKNIDARALITGFQFLQAYYPERLAKCYMLSMPWFFVRVWKMVCHFLEKATKEKVVIVNTEEEHNRFVEEIGEDVLPEEYGGRAKLVALQDVNLTHFPVKEGTS